MPTTQRHSRLSQPSNSSQNTRPRRPRKQRARTVRELVRALEKEEQVAKKQIDAEARQLDTYTAMALRHLPEDSVLANLPDDVWRKFITACVLSSFFRSCCSSTQEIESIALGILEKLQTGKLNDAEKSQIESRVCSFLLGKCGVDVSKTLEEAEFAGTPELKNVYANEWKNDPTFTSYSKCDIKTLLRIRQRLTEKLNSMIYAVFEQQRGTESPYSKALKKASQKIQASMIIVNPLPMDYEIEVRFCKEVCRILKMFDILKEWAANYGEEPSRSLIMRLPNILNNRAIRKQQESMSLVSARLIKMIKANRKSDEVEEDDDEFTMSQPSLFLSQIARSPPTSQKRYQSQIQRLCDLTNSDDEDSSSDLFSILEKEVPGYERSNKTSKQSPPRKPSPPRKRKPSPPRKRKPTLPRKRNSNPPRKQTTAVPQKQTQNAPLDEPRTQTRSRATFTGTINSVPRKRSSTSMTSERPNKKAKTSNLFDGLPDLEKI